MKSFLKHIIEEGEKEFDEKFGDIKETHPQILGFAKNISPAIKSFLHQHTIDILEAMKNSLPKEKEQLDTNDLDNYGACYAIGGFNDAISKVSSFIDRELAGLKK